MSDGYICGTCGKRHTNIFNHKHLNKEMVTFTDQKIDDIFKYFKEKKKLEDQHIDILIRYSLDKEIIKYISELYDSVQKETNLKQEDLHNLIKERLRNRNWN